MNSESKSRVYPVKCQLILKIQIICDIERARYVFKKSKRTPSNVFIKLGHDHFPIMSFLKKNLGMLKKNGGNMHLVVFSYSKIMPNFEAFHETFSSRTNPVIVRRVEWWCYVDLDLTKNCNLIFFSLTEWMNEFFWEYFNHRLLVVY